MSDRKYRVGLAAFYFKLFDDVMPAAFRREREDVAREYVRLLSPRFEVVYPGLIDDDAAGAAAGEAFAGAGVDAVVLAPTMAAPPSYGMAALERFRTPVVIWNVPTAHTFPESLHQDEATRHTTLVGCIMLGNALSRHGLTFQTVTAALDDEAACDRLLRTIVGACAARRLSSSRFARIGGIIPGYLDVDVSAEEFRRGMRGELVEMDESVVNDAFRKVTDGEVQGVIDELRLKRWEFDRLPDETLRRSARLAAALESIVRDCELSGGAINCHGACFRQHEHIGIVGCLAVTRLTALGIPFACTGDVLTGTALWLGQEVAGAAMYCECYAMEQDTGLMLLAAGGEGDPRMAAAGASVKVQANHHYPGKCGAGASVAFPIAAGPATLLSLSPIRTTRSGWALAWATGEVVESKFPEMGGPNAMFRFDRSDLALAAEAWISSGATHHNALVPGNREIELMSLAAALQIDQVRI